MMLWLAKRVAIAALFYLGYIAVLVWLHPRLIYPFDQRPFSGANYTRLEISVPGAAPLPVWVAKGEAGAPVVVYFMGNVGALDLFLPMLDYHRQAGRSVVAMGYRGGGGVAGTPSEARLKSDALAVIDALPDLVGAEQGARVVHGFSLGSGLALHVANERPVDGVLLSAPYNRLCEVMARRAYVPACLIPGVQAWRSADHLAGIGAPVEILHGSADSLIPPVQSARLEAALRASGVPVTRRVLPGGGHNDLMGQPGYLAAIDAFIQGLSAG